MNSQTLISNTTGVLVMAMLFLCWALFTATSWVIERRKQIGADKLDNFATEYTDAQIYEMALQLPKKKKNDCPTVSDVWEKYGFLSKRQAYKVIAEWKNISKRWE